MMLCRRLVVFSAFGLLGLFSGECPAIDRNWIGGSDFWNIDSNWDPFGQPQPADDANVDGSPEVTDVELFNELANSGDIRITVGTLQPSGEVTNNGTINVGDGSSIRSQMIVAQGMTLGGNGVVILKNSDNLPGSNAILRGGSSSAAVHEAGHTIRGEGSIIQRWQNDGTIIAEETSGDSSAVLRLDNATFINNGELRSSSGASINLNFMTYSQGASGQLIADSDNITLTGITTITGGSLESVAGGIFDSNGLVTLEGVTVNAPIDNTNLSGAPNDARLRIGSGGLTNNSTISLAGVSGRNSQFGFSASGTLDGTGELVLLNGDSNTFVGVFPGAPFEFTQGANHTIRGAGVIASSIINNGTIRAEPGSSGSILRFDFFQTNNGLMQAGAGATLEFQSNVSNTVQGAMGVISAANGGAVELENTVITGGRLETSGTGTMTVTASSTLNSVTNAGNLDVLSSRVLRIGGGALTNDGTITINSNGGTGVPSLAVLQDTLLSGSGELVLDGTNNNSRSDVVPNGFTITHDTNHTVRGNGEIIGPGTFVNNGRIEGDSAAAPVRIRTRVEGIGTLKDVSIDFNSNVSVHAPGIGVGTVPLEGSYAITHPLVRLEIELGGTAAGTEHDLLDSTGTMSLGGILDVRAVDLGNSYIPTAGDRFTIIQSTSPITGTFASSWFPLIGFGRSLTWQPVDYSNPLEVTLEIASVAFLDADFDEDGDVDGDDLVRWQANFGSGTTHMQGDADGNGDVDGRDFLRWQRQFGLGVSTLPATQVVPEPASQILLLFALCLLRCSTRTGNIAGELHSVSPEP